MLTYILLIKPLSAVLASKITNSDYHPLSYTHRDIANTGTSSIVVTVLPNTKTFTSVITEKLLAGENPGGLTWNAEFIPDASATWSTSNGVQSWTWAEDRTAPASNYTTSIAAGKGKKWLTSYDQWAKYMGPGYYELPAEQFNYEKDQYNTLFFNVQRTSAIYRNLQTNSEPIVYMIETGR